MRYYIVVNMDYDTNPQDDVNRLFEEIRLGLVSRGFRQDGRIFGIGLPAEEACALARQVVEEVAAAEKFLPKNLYSYMKDFYGFQKINVVNLLVPGEAGISVTELDELQ